jgi:hypothetical protein
VRLSEPGQSGIRRRPAHAQPAHRGKAAGRIQGALLMWIFGGRGQRMHKNHDVYIDMASTPGADQLRTWQGVVNLFGPS